MTAYKKTSRTIRLLLWMSMILLSHYAWSLDVSLSVLNREASTKTAEPITSGVPFAQGVLTDITKLKLMQGNTEIPAQFRKTASWPDGSIKWVLMDFQLNLPASASTSLTLQTNTSPSPISGITVDNQSNTLSVNTGTSTFTFQKNQLLIGSRSFQVRSGGTTYTAVPDSGKWTIEESGSMKTIVKAEGLWVNGSSTLANSLVGFKARLIFYRNKNNVRVLFTFKNNNSFGWQSDKGQSVTLSNATFDNLSILPDSGSYVLGQGVEKTWEIDVPASGSPVNFDSRYTASGTLAGGYSAPHPITAATPAYYVSTGAWGQMSLPLSGFSSGIQEDFDRFEKLQRAKVIQSDVENPPNLTGISLWGHLYEDINSWHDYGDLRWGGDDGPLSSNHYDWIYGMLLHFMRTGHIQFIDAAKVFARHEIDFDIYHTTADANAYNYQKNWESRPSHDSPDNSFGPGRPSHTWNQGYALYWLLTGDPRGKDAYDEIKEGLRLYIYESFNENGYINTNEIRVQGWLTENLVTVWRIEPSATFQTSNYGSKTIQQALKDVLKSVFDLEKNAGNHGYIIDGDPPESNLSAPIQHCYFIEPAIKAYAEVFKGRDTSYASSLLNLIRRITTWLMSVTYGGNTNGSGAYLPRQIPYRVDRNLSQQTEGQIPYLLMAANAAGFCYMETGEAAFSSYMRPVFQDYIRYLGIEGGDNYIEDPSRRTATSYNSSVYVNTESKIHGWSNRYGQYYLAAESSGSSTPTLSIISPNGGEIWSPGSKHSITWSSTGSIPTVKIEYSTNNGSSWITVSASTANSGSLVWDVPPVSSTQCRVKITSTANSSITDTSDSTFTIGSAAAPTIVLSKTNLIFGAAGSTTTKTQQVLISSSTGTLSWSAASSASWLTVTPAAGTGNSIIEIGIDKSGLSYGTHTGTITISDTHASNSPQTINVTFNYPSEGNAPIGVIETPQDQSTVMSSVAVTGWALDDVEVETVKIWREPITGEGTGLIYIGDAVFVEGMRPDVEAAMPQYPLNYRAGWGYMLLTYGLPGKGLNHTFTIHAIAYDKEGRSTDLGTKTITCNNAAAVKPFGAIDVPAQGGIASGSAYINWGWVLTPLPNQIPVNGSSIDVIIDGVNRGHPGYNIYRQDISDMFPGYANSSGPIGYFYLDTTAYENGIHTIQWTATDNGSNTDGIGSRYFTVLNTAQDQKKLQPKQTTETISIAEAVSSQFEIKYSPVRVIKGLEESAEIIHIVPDHTGTILVDFKAQERIRIDFSNISGDKNDTETNHWVYGGFMTVGNELRPLPVGSTLDTQKGIFYWLPGPGFKGDYEFVFLKENKGQKENTREKIKLRININSGSISESVGEIQKGAGKPRLYREPKKEGHGQAMPLQYSF